MIVRQLNAAPKMCQAKIRLQAGAELQPQTHEGRDYLVAPVVMIVEGVVNGELVRATTLAASVPGWNGRPVLLNHPDHVGVPVSANTPKTLSDQQIGLIFNAHMEDNKLIAEAWLDVEKISELGERAERILEAIRNHDQVEISTGYYSQITNESGTFEGEDYSGIQTFWIPDHLAILTDQNGACSWKDGCGIPRAASQEPELQGGGTMAETVKELKEKFKGFLEEHFGFRVDFKEPDDPGDIDDGAAETREVTACQHCEKDHDEVSFREHVDDQGGKSLIGSCPETQGPIVINTDTGCGCDDVPDDKRIKINGATLAQALRQMFQERESATGRSRDQLIARIATSAEVRRNVVVDFVEGKVDFPSERLLAATALVLDKAEHYIWMAADVDTAKYRRPPQPVVITPNNEEDEMTREQVVDALCLNQSLGITDEVKAQLLALESDDDFFTEVAKLQSAPADPPPAEEPPTAPAQNAADPPPAAEPPASMAKWLEGCPDPDYRDQQLTLIAQNKARRKSLTDKLVENGAFTKEELADIKLETLERFARTLGLVQDHPDYSGGRPYPVANAGNAGETQDDMPEMQPVLLAKDPLRPIAVQ